MNREHKKGLAYGVVAALLTVASGYWSGVLANRWGSSADVQAIAAQLDRVSKQLDGWEMASVDELGKGARDILQCSGELMRTYVSSATGERIKVAVLLGPSGPISRHDPNICYPSSGYKVAGEPARETFTVGEKKIDLWTTLLQPPELGGENLKVVWGWNDGSGWSAPDNARYSFAGKPYLLKIQVACPVKASANRQAPAVAEFVAQFLPLLDSQVSAPQ